MEFKFLSRHFPPPQSLKPSHVGVSFSDTSIKAIAFEKNSKTPSFKSTLVPLEKGAVVNGSIVNLEEVVKKLSIVRKNFASPFVFFTVSDELSYVFSASVPTSGSDITEAIAFIIEENVPLSLDETIFDFVPTQIIPSESEYSASAVVVACAKKEVEKFIEVFRRAGFEPIGCIHESQAIARAVIPRQFSGTFCVIHARGDRVGIHLIKNRVIHFSTIRTILKGDYKNEFLDEYKKFLEYCLKYDTNQTQPIKAVLICGEFEDAQKVLEAMDGSADLPKNVKLANVWTNIFKIDKYAPDIPFEKSLSFAGSIGAALSDLD